VRVVTIVIDSGGVGALDDFAAFGDAPGANTIGNVAARAGGLRLPNLERLGLGSLASLRGVPPAAQPQARVARLAARSLGKDSVTGHWEMTGLLTAIPFPTYPRGFPPNVVEKFTEIAGAPPLGNVAASGTELLDRFGAEHLATGRPILYTSADSVFQVAAHEEVIPLSTLYRWCEEAREMLVPPHNVSRVIARPFRGRPGSFYRTPNRRDYAIEPARNVLDEMAARGIQVHAVGKICDIFCGRSIATSARANDDRGAMQATFDLLARIDRGFVFTNLNDFDSKFGHRRDARGYAAALEELDGLIGELQARLRPGDHAILTADHGCDPTAPGSDHTREFVPFLHLGPAPGALLGEMAGLDVVGKTALRAFEAAD
jgi:phosphopentomutase